ncbi:MAG: UDP-N-acetylglucosamine 2-epimerase (non-hydrolyzing) [bacterium]|nr:UDP-N-acetylglucosamine 2-epimerase (non-hydrolyzing) [bacterium]
MKNILFVFGTRPEAIKLIPLIKIFKQDQSFNTGVCVTAQHRDMLNQVLNLFCIKPDYDLDIMRQNQSLFDVTVEGLKEIDNVMDDFNADLVIVQGDTTTTFTGALAGYYKKIKVGHVEAGLRSNNKYSPYPEEMNRKLVSLIADFHFAPTDQAVNNLKKEGIVENVWCVGNTVVDALFTGLDMVKQQGDQQYYNRFSNIDFSKKIILVTGHRRESFGRIFEGICLAIKEIAERFNDVTIIYPVHLNPKVRETVSSILAGIENIYLIEPVDYPELIWLMSKSYMILTDSGGIQEEAPSLNKPVLVMRDITERTEGLDNGTARLAGTDQKKIVSEVSELLGSKKVYDSMAHKKNPYGDGAAAKRILDIIKQYQL